MGIKASFFHRGRPTPSFDYSTRRRAPPPPHQPHMHRCARRVHVMHSSLHDAFMCLACRLSHAVRQAVCSDPLAGGRLGGGHWQPSCQDSCLILPLLDMLLARPS